VDVRDLSAQSGNTDWVLFTCRKCGRDSGLVDDQKNESACDWYDSSRFAWLSEARKELERSEALKPKPGVGTF
jgi:hypothetical protein